MQQGFLYALTSTLSRLLLLFFFFPNSQPSYQYLQAHLLRWVGRYLFAFAFSFLSLFPPTPNPLPSGKRALRFASPGFYPPPLLLPIN